MSIPKLRLRISSDARRDLRDTRRYSRRRWDEDHAEEYLRKLNSGFELLRAHPELSHERPEFGKGVRSRFVESHIVIFAVFDDLLIIGRVIDQR
jgi:plasmid stabilization system protein ParE